MSQAMEGSVVLVTGSTDGIGKQTALELAQLGATVLVHGRTPERAQRACAELKSASGNAMLESVAADFSSLAQVRALAQTLHASHPRLHVLINNAGVYLPGRKLSAEGYELTWGVNYLAPFLLTALVTDLLEAGAREGRHARVVNVASTVHASGSLAFNQRGVKRKYDAYAAYADSKLALVMFTYELARRQQGRGITANSLHPGVIGTKLLHAGFRVSGSSLDEGAATPVYLATSPEVENVTGKYFAQKTAVASSPLSTDETLQAELWRRSEQWTGL